MNDKIHCPVIVGYNGVAINASDLVSIARANEVFELKFINAADQEHSILFQLNGDLSVQHSTFNTQGLAACQFEGYSLENDHNALSACSTSDIGGILKMNGEYFVLFAESDGTFALLPQTSSNCLWSSARKRRDVDKSTNFYSKYMDGRWRYVELSLMADYSMFVKYGRNVTKVLRRIETISNFINSLYQPLNIRVILSWADVWAKADLIDISENSDETLKSFLQYRRNILKLHHNDNAHLLTNVVFANNIVGKAYKGTMCSYEYSGGVDMDHSSHAAFVAATVAHEMGHNFGMDHDDLEACNCAEHSCIMAAATGGAKSPSFWSECSLRALHQGLSRGGLDYCLYNQPDKAFSGARCGNSIVESGEECDCGTESSCTHRCCDFKTCKLVKDALCANGLCCNLETCQFKPRTTVCRNATGSCDLLEYCDGYMEYCPADFFVQDGHVCPDDVSNFCHNGICGSRDRQCQHLWGPSGKNAANICYDFNRLGSHVGNCGYDDVANTFVHCNQSDIHCGRLQCWHEAEKLSFGDPSLLSASYNPTGPGHRQVACRVVWRNNQDKSLFLDPGLVPNGASCGDNKICVDQKCQNRSEMMKMSPKCEPESCYDAGICNNMGNCHCLPGYGGTGCGIPGPGGSVNSGPATNGAVVHVGMLVLWMNVLFLVLFIVASVYIKRRNNTWLHKQIWRSLKNFLDIHRLLVPVRKAPPPPEPSVRATKLDAVVDFFGDTYRSKNSSKPFLTTVNESFGPTECTGPGSHNFARCFAPPQIPHRPDINSLSELYAERGNEMFLSSKKVRRMESVNRPINPPPPPPHTNLLHESSSKTVKNLRVRDIAANFDSASACSRVIGHKNSRGC